jgi:hypothetical protein
MELELTLEELEEREAQTIPVIIALVGKLSVIVVVNPLFL